VGTHHDLEQVFELHRRGLTHVQRAECELDDVNEAFEQVLDGSAPAPRMVFRLQPAGPERADKEAKAVHA
jgi:propanol-preferring alcohol dehydrogenase